MFCFFSSTCAYENPCKINTDCLMPSTQSWKIFPRSKAFSWRFPESFVGYLQCSYSLRLIGTDSVLWLTVRQKVKLIDISGAVQVWDVLISFRCYEGKIKTTFFSSVIPLIWIIIILQNSLLFLLIIRY